MKRPRFIVIVVVLIGLVVVNSLAYAQASPTPAVTHNARMASPAITRDFELVHLVQDFAPGAATPVHTHGGQGLALVLAGELTQRRAGQPDQVFKTGDTFVETPGEYFAVANLSSAPARLSVAFLLPKGATLTTPHQPQPPELPRTGDASAPTMTFPETGYSLDGEFLRYWRAQGGLPVFGYPMSSAQPVDGQIMQYLERARFELHPQHAAPYNVLLGRLGVEALERQGVDWRLLPKASPNAAHYVEATGHAIAAEFWGYWSSRGLEFDGQRGASFAESLALFGYPISEARMEVNSSGDQVLTQWFERVRMEYHPDNPADYRVLLGRLGAELHGR